MSYAEDDNVDWGLELSMLLSDDCVAAPELANAMHEAPGMVAYEAPAEDEGAAAEEQAPKKTVLAVVEV
jgi:hypothetical protein